MSPHSVLGAMYIFPGQGAQYVGMGSDIYRDFAAARAVYLRASEVVGFDVAKLSFQGPREQLDRTEFTQPALLTHSIACLAAFRELMGNEVAPAAVAGHSLGEYSALVAAGALTFDDALRLVRRRGQLMAEHGRGKMVPFRLDLESIKPLADAYYCGIGGCNLPSQTVVCGLKSDLDALIEEVTRRHGTAKAGRYLNTEGAFHTYLMVGAAEQFRPCLESTPVAAPGVKVLSNYTGEYHSPDPARIKACLFFQIFHPVRWMRGLQTATADGVDTVIEFGGGIGRDQPGLAQSPASRKPNLEGVTRSALNAVGREGWYLPAINSGSLRQAVATIRGLRKIATVISDKNERNERWIDERLFRLYLPVAGGLTNEKAVNLAVRLQEMNLIGLVQIVSETCDESIRALQSCCAPGILDAEPYLEIVVGGTTGAFIQYRGDDIVQQLSELRRGLEQRGRRSEVS